MPKIGVFVEKMRLVTLKLKCMYVSLIIYESFDNINISTSTQFAQNPFSRWWLIKISIDSMEWISKQNLMWIVSVTFVLCFKKKSYSIRNTTPMTKIHQMASLWRNGKFMQIILTNVKYTYLIGILRIVQLMAFQSEISASPSLVEFPFLFH